MPKLKNILTVSAVSNYTPLTGTFTEFYTELNGSIVHKAKKSDGTITNITTSSDLQLTDPGLYTAFLVTATADKNLQYIEIIAGCLQLGITPGDKTSIGSYNVIVDWGDGTQDSYEDTTLVTTATGATNLAKWTSGCSYYGVTFTEQRLSIYYYHTYTTAGTYKVKFIGTKYYHFRTQKSAKNLISRCLLKDLPLYSGITRLQGSFNSTTLLTSISCPANYVWPTQLKDVTAMLSGTPLTSVGNMKLPNTVLSTTALFNGTKIKTGIHIPDSVVCMDVMYYNCPELLSIPDLGTNGRTYQRFASVCTKLKRVEGKMPSTAKFAQQAFLSTPELLTPPVFSSDIVWAGTLTIGGLTYLFANNPYLNNGYTHTVTECVSSMFLASGILCPPTTLGTVQSGISLSGIGVFRNCRRMKHLPKLPSGLVDCTLIFANCKAALYCLKINSSGSYNPLWGTIVADILPATCTNLTRAFINCLSLIDAPLIPSGVTSVNSCFRNCVSLKWISADAMFQSCTVLTDMSFCFCNCMSLQSMPYNLPATVTTLAQCFYNCKSIKGGVLGSLANLTALTNIASMCMGCSSIIYWDSKIPASVLDAHQAFLGCTLARTLPFFDTSAQATNVSSMYSLCYDITQLLSYYGDAALRIPSTVTSCTYFMARCISYSKDIINTVYADFSADSVGVTQAFYGCKKLTLADDKVSVLAGRLWNNASASKFTNTSLTFRGCSDTLRANVPSSWGGTAA